MTIRPPRRIFRAQTLPASHRNGLGRTVMVGLVGALIGAFVVLIGLPSELFGRVPPASGQFSADPALVAVVDGDTLRLSDRVVRLQGVEAPPRGQICRHADGATFDCGAAAVAALADLVRGHSISCQIGERDNAGFTQGMCTAGATDLNRTMVASGWAHARADTPAFGAEESHARSEQRGLWRSGASF